MINFTPKNSFKKSLIASAIFSTSLLFSPQSASALEQGSTDTGLDLIVEIIKTDERLQRKISAQDIDDGAIAADEMNQLIIDAIIETGVANDGTINTADTRELNDYLYENYNDIWLVLHGDDEGDEETGFHLVQNDGAKTRIFRKNAINRVADSIYHLGFESNRKNRLLNEDGDKNASYRRVGEWLDALLIDDLQGETLKNPAIQEVYGTTGTGLDQIIDIIYSDDRLQEKVSTGDIREAATAANEMNRILVEAINVNDVASDGIIDANDARTINQYIRENHKAEWAILHGDDEVEGEETGFHLVQRDGAKTKIFERNAINRVIDGIYHLGFEASANGRRILNEDGNKNASFKKIGQWLTGIYFTDVL